jgi:hypothetical protein
VLSTLDEVGMGLNPSPVGWGEKDREKNNHISWEIASNRSRLAQSCKMIVSNRPDGSSCGWNCSIFKTFHLSKPWETGILTLNVFSNYFLIFYTWVGADKSVGVLPPWLVKI